MSSFLGLEGRYQDASPGLMTPADFAAHEYLGRMVGSPLLEQGLGSGRVKCTPFQSLENLNQQLSWKPQIWAPVTLAG